MLLDSLDQETMRRLPHLPDVYDAYGVEVNALSVEEIFALYERTGFLRDMLARRLLHKGYDVGLAENARSFGSRGDVTAN